MTFEIHHSGTNKKYYAKLFDDKLNKLLTTNVFETKEDCYKAIEVIKSCADVPVEDLT